MTGNACVRFAYIMYGKHVGQLKVNGRAASGVEGAPWWAEAGDQGNSWFERNLDVSLTSNSKVITFFYILFLHPFILKIHAPYKDTNIHAYILTYIHTYTHTHIDAYIHNQIEHIYVYLS